MKVSGIGVILRKENDDEYNLFTNKYMSTGPGVDSSKLYQKLSVEPIIEMANQSKLFHSFYFIQGTCCFCIKRNF